jgi:hypothetical protein
MQTQANVLYLAARRPPLGLGSRLTRNRPPQPPDKEVIGMATALRLAFDVEGVRMTDAFEVAHGCSTAPAASELLVRVESTDLVGRFFAIYARTASGLVAIGDVRPGQLASELAYLTGR